MPEQSDTPHSDRLSCTMSLEDHAFREQLENGRFPVSNFDHRAHLRLAYVYLCRHPVTAAVSRMSQSIKNLLKANHINPDKYHVTLTYAWVLGVRHFMDRSPGAQSADAFIEQNPALLDTHIMLSHYSPDVLFSDAARRRFVAADREPIPRCNDVTAAGKS